MPYAHRADVVDRGSCSPRLGRGLCRTPGARPCGWPECAAADVGPWL